MAKAIMIQGTMSNAGKSLITAGLCRIFKQDGYRVAPFKSQNMALNSFVTDEGLEMGRAQVVQAEAAGAEPSVLMNPILLKPTGDMGSQVIVNGEVRGNMSAGDYFRYKKELIPDIMSAYRTLDEAYDIIVIEGAGSPAEINLKSDDIVNMGMAKRAGAPVLLVGDIDRGGVFAQLYGTIFLLEDEERDLVKGLIINKFRGDRAILDPGIEMLRNLCKKDIVGVVPWMDVDLEDEDSLSERLEQRRSGYDRTGNFRQDSNPEIPAVDIAVIRFPRISNFTDFHYFESMRGVLVRYITKVSELGSPDLIFLPGTKNTMRDLRWLRQSGLEAAVIRAKERGVVIFGICGGYQMLGRLISDPEGVEEGGSIRGIGLLPMDTVFSGKKIRTRVEGYFGKVGGVLENLTGAAVSGYEIHMGQSTFSGGCGDGRELLSERQQEDLSDDGRKLSSEQAPEGLTGNGLCTDPGKVCPLACVADLVSGERKSDGAYLGNVYGTYIHGVFDGEEAAGKVIRALAERRGIEIFDDAFASSTFPEWENTGYAAYKEQQYDKLAAVLRQHLDMERIYEILEAGVSL
ncbi:MAG: cobyric acid synthase [Clostridiales bacterium]|nr:cobyric acid synthase [Clostridiales bacterium]